MPFFTVKLPEKSWFSSTEGAQGIGRMGTCHGVFINHYYILFFSVKSPEIIAYGKETNGNLSCSLYKVLQNEHILPEKSWVTTMMKE